MESFLWINSDFMEFEVNLPFLKNHLEHSAVARAGFCSKFHDYGIHRAVLIILGKVHGDGHIRFTVPPNLICITVASGDPNWDNNLIAWGPVQTYKTLPAPKILQSKQTRVEESQHYYHHIKDREKREIKWRAQGHTPCLCGGAGNSVP